MSQIEQDFRLFLNKFPEVEFCYSEKLINRRSLARYLIKQDVADSKQFDALIAMLRRFDFRKTVKQQRELEINRINIKDRIAILEFEKSKELVKGLEKAISVIDYDKGDVLKIVVGTSTVKLFVDKGNEKKILEVVKSFKLSKKVEGLSEMSVIFSENASVSKGILSTVTREFSVNGIVLIELLTASPELLIYINEKDVVGAYNIFKRLQGN